MKQILLLATVTCSLTFAGIITVVQLAEACDCLDLSITGDTTAAPFSDCFVNWDFDSDVDLDNSGCSGSGSATLTYDTLAVHSSNIDLDSDSFTPTSRTVTGSGGVFNTVVGVNLISTANEGDHAVAAWVFFNQPANVDPDCYDEHTCHITDYYSICP